MRHVVFGAGLIGGYLGGALIDSGLSVGWVVRPATRKKLSRGLLLTDYAEHRQQFSDLEFVDIDGQVEPADVIWLTVKCTVLDQACEDMAPLVGPNTLIIALQNGLGAEAKVQAKFPETKVIRGVFSANVAELAEGHLHRGTEGGLDLPNTPDTRAIQKQFNSALLPLDLYDNLEGLLWAKLQLNLNNPINALSNIPLKLQLEQREYRKVLKAAMLELLRVADKSGVELPKLTRIPPRWIPRLMGLPDWLFKRLASQMLSIDPSARSSMWEDLSTGRKTEIDFLNGAVADQGERLGVECPANRQLQRLVKSVEAGEQVIGLTGADLYQEVLAV